MKHEKYEKHGCNNPLRTPKYTRARILYQSVDELMSEGNSNFIPTWDSTDHFHFCCADCRVMADVLQARFLPYPIDEMGKKKIFAIMLFLGCPKCGSTGMRKMYFKPTSFMGHHAYTGKAELMFAQAKEAIGYADVKLERGTRIIPTKKG
jgi:hypothetical protein